MEGRARTVTPLERSRRSRPAISTSRRWSSSRANNSKHISLQSMYLCKRLTDKSCRRSAAFAGSTTTTLIHAYRKIEAMRERDKEFCPRHSAVSRSRSSRYVHRIRGLRGNARLWIGDAGPPKRPQGGHPVAHRTLHVLGRRSNPPATARAGFWRHHTGPASATIFYPRNVRAIPQSGWTSVTTKENLLKELEVMAGDRGEEEHHPDPRRTSSSTRQKDQLELLATDPRGRHPHDLRGQVTKRDRSPSEGSRRSCSYRSRRRGACSSRVESRLDADHLPEGPLQDSCPPRESSRR